MSVSNRLSTVVPTTAARSINGTLGSVFENKYALLFVTLSPALLLYVFVAVLPMAWAVNLSLYEVSTLNPVWEWVGPGRYAEILTNPEFQSAFVRSLLFGFGSVALQLILGVALALLVNRDFRGAVLARAIALVPYMVPAVVIGMVGSFMLNAQYGVINLLLLRIGVLDQPLAFLGTPETAMATIMVVASWKFAVFVTLMTLARLQSIPENYYESATMCGASAWDKFRDITLPRIQNVILLVALLRTLWMFNKFDIVWIMTKGGPGAATTTVPVFAYQVAFNQFELGRAAGIAALMFVLLAVWSLLYFRTAKPAKEVRTE